MAVVCTVVVIVVVSTGVVLAVDFIVVVEASTGVVLIFVDVSVFGVDVVAAGVAVSIGPLVSLIFCVEFF